MRVLIIPELYRPAEASANGTFNDAVTWVERWLDLDDTLHVYWLLAPRGRANYDRSDVFADRERVTLIEARPFMSRQKFEWLFTESGYSEEQLYALKREIYDKLGYVDVIIDQMRVGRSNLYKWLLYLSGNRPGTVHPFSLVVNVHDLMLPYKYAESGHRSEYSRRLEVVEAVLADGRWFKARLDAEEMAVYGREFLPEPMLEEALADSLMTDSPIDISHLDETYAEEPQWLHVAGSGWEKKRLDVVMEIAELLFDRYDIRTVITSMYDIPQRYRRLPFVEAYPQASRETYETMLARGDLAVCATEYETLARTWFEQSASGQVLVVRDEPWIRETVPDDYRLKGSVDDLADLTCWAVEHWDEAISENRRLVQHIRDVRNPDRAGRKTFADVVRRVNETTAAYKTPDRKALRRAFERVDDKTVSLDELNRAGAEFTWDGEPLLDQKWCSLGDLVFSLRERGFEDTGNPGTPVFRLADDDSEGDEA